MDHMELSGEGVKFCIEECSRLGSYRTLKFKGLRFSHILHVHWDTSHIGRIFASNILPIWESLVFLPSFMDKTDDNVMKSEKLN